MKKIPGGYYIKARKIQGSDIAHAAPAVREIWDYLLREANHRDAKYGGYTVKRGQLFRSYQDIREALSWFVGFRKMRYSEDATKKAMKALREQRRITTMKAPGGVLITILNYDFYQNPKNYEGTDESTDEGTIEALRRHQCGTTYNNKNEKNERNNSVSKDTLAESPIPSIQEEEPLPPPSNEPNPPKTPLCPQQKIIELYHRLLPELPEIKDWNRTLEGYLRARWREKPERQALDWWADLFSSYIRASDFLMGRVNNFQADLGWLVRPNNFTKILNGRYKNRGPSEVKPTTYGQCQDAERRQRARNLVEELIEQRGGAHGKSQPEDDHLGAEASVVCLPELAKTG